jgi:hypothetical protein
VASPPNGGTSDIPFGSGVLDTILIPPGGRIKITRTPLKLLEDQVSLIFEISCGTQPPLYANWLIKKRRNIMGNSCAIFSAIAAQ